jgi:hypothetical protein
MNYRTGTIYIVYLKNSRQFCAKLIEHEGSMLCFESKSGIQSQHFEDEIYSVKAVA